MLNNWNEFITESNLISLLLERECSATTAFLTKIGSISTMSKVAKVLSDVFSEVEYIEKDLPQNYIDITDKDDMITFLSDARLNRNPDENPYQMSGRGEMAIGRFARRFIQELKSDKNLAISYGDLNLTDRDFEEFVNLYKSTNVKSENVLKLVEGELISFYYNEDNYAFQTGTLGGSCMRHDECQSFLEIYTYNTKSCRLLVYVDSDNKLLGRALVWKVSKSPASAEYFMDRVYTANDSDVHLFTNYAKQNGWLYKYKMNSYDKENIIFYHNGEVVIGVVEVKLKETEWYEYPFMDTLRYVNTEKGIISNVGSKGHIVCSDTEGGYDDCCCHCGGSGEVDDHCPVCYTTGKKNCDDCSGTGDVKCPKCHGEGNSNKEVVCLNCNGNGKVIKNIRRVVCRICNGIGTTMDICDRCNGFGDVKCEKCKGQGSVNCDLCSGVGTIQGGCPYCSWNYISVLRSNLNEGYPTAVMNRIKKAHDLEIKIRAKEYEKTKERKKRK